MSIETNLVCKSVNDKFSCLLLAQDSFACCELTRLVFQLCINTQWLFAMVFHQLRLTNDLKQLELVRNRFPALCVRYI